MRLVDAREALKRMTDATDEEVAVMLNHVAAAYGRQIVRVELMRPDPLLAVDLRDEMELEAASVHLIPKRKSKGEVDR